VFIELADYLRCPRLHEETWLVASSSRTEGRNIIEGTLGCPICRAEYPIRAGTVWFTERERRGHAAASSPSAVDPELAIRLAAFLDLRDAQGFALLAGSWGQAARLLRDVVATNLVLLNPRPPVDATAGVSVLEIDSAIPLATATCHAVALDEHHGDAAHVDSAVRVLRPSGRLVAPASTPLPGGVTELARDETLWVAEREAGKPRIVTLERGTS
jgi:uncharacterized protein YbaR (Trm112 family)